MKLLRNLSLAEILLLKSSAFISDSPTGLYPHPVSERMHQHIVDIKLVVLPGAAHTAIVEEPEAVNEAIIDFLEGSQNEFQFTEKNRAQN